MTSSTEPYKDKVCILTGVASTLGIGRATAVKLSQQGAAALYLCDILPTSSPEMQSLLTSMRSLSPTCKHHLYTFDAADSQAVQQVITDALAEYNRLDFFFANAGSAGPPLHIRDINESHALGLLRTNYLSVLWAIQHTAALVPATQSPPAAIVATASVAGLRANAGSAAYSASKAAVISLVQSAAFGYAGTGIRINAVLPGLIETEMTRQAIFEPARKRGNEAKIGQLCPLGRAGQADEVAAVVAFLGSPQAAYVHGQCWTVDGGLSAGLPFVRGKLA